MSNHLFIRNPGMSEKEVMGVKTKDVERTKTPGSALSNSGGFEVLCSYGSKFNDLPNIAISDWPETDGQTSETTAVAQTTNLFIRNPGMSEKEVMGVNSTDVIFRNTTGSAGSNREPEKAYGNVEPTFYP